MCLDELCSHCGFILMMQDFWQRTRNYVQRLLVSYFALGGIRAEHKMFVRATGCQLQFHKAGVFDSAAVITVVDWVLEYPQPLPPRFMCGVNSCNEYSCC